jgi:hypothetical protein
VAGLPARRRVLVEGTGPLPARRLRQDPPALGLAYEAWGNPEKAAEYRVLLEETDEVGVYQIGDV